jgi:prepilin-type processing-associated H-X9-DG protein
MRTFITTVVFLLAAVTAGALVVVGVTKARQGAQLTQCNNNLRHVGLALQAHHDTYKRFPTGTVPNANLPPEKRFSWLIEIWPAFMESGPQVLIDKTKAWDTPGNCPPRWRLFSLEYGTQIGNDFVGGDMCVFLCPANATRGGPSMPSLTHYVGVAGLGEAAANLPLIDPKAGLFGYDREVALKDLKHGAATTMAVAETLDGGPWTAGGHATVRGLVLDRLPYVGVDGQFTSNHAAGTNILFADASVRTMTASAAKTVIEAMATIAGDEAAARFDE